MLDQLTTHITNIATIATVIATAAGAFYIGRRNKKDARLEEAEIRARTAEQDTIAAQNSRIETLEGSIRDYHTKQAELLRKIESLQTRVDSLAEENRVLRSVQTAEILSSTKLIMHNQLLIAAHVGVPTDKLKEPKDDDTSS